MGWDRQSQVPGGSLIEGGAPAPSAGPGKHTLTETLAGAPLQRAAMAGAGAGSGEGDGDDVHATAQSGIAGAGAPLPHAEAIQASFGHHDVTDVRAHVGGAAAEASSAIGAFGYASGDDVAFAAAPDLHLAAHEA